MYTITFYSFKGGVGRTMALVNVGAELVRRGRRVLLVDFDLEAPGLTSYEALRQQGDHPGVVEYVTEYIRTKESPDISRFIYSVDLARLRSRRKGRKTRKRPAETDSRQSPGQLWIMPAGKGDAAYGAALATINWNSLYENLDGYLFFEDTKLQWQEAIKPDYVLIDSRTGHTDVGGICTRQLADAVVLLFTPNEQNLAGLKTVCDDIRLEETEGLKKHIRLHFVAANVPDLDDEHRIVRRQLQDFRERLNFNDLSGMIRRYENLSLLDQSIFVVDRPHSRLAHSYRRLGRTLLKDNAADRDGALYFLQDYPERRETRIEGKHRGNRVTMIMTDEDGQIHHSGGISVPQSEDKNRLREIARHFDGEAEILNKVAECFISEQDFRSAVQMYDRALISKPIFGDALLNRAICKLNLGLVDDAAADLLDCLRLPYSNPHYSAIDKLGETARAFFKGAFHQTVLAKLHDIAPRRMFDVADMLETQGFLAILQREDQDRGAIFLSNVVSFLCDTEAGVNRAARLLRETKTISAVPDKILLRAHCWKEIIQSRGAGRSEQRGASEILTLALARWGEDGEMPESLCKQALEALEGDNLFVHHWGLQGIALLFWRTGNVTDAMECLEKAEQRAVAETDQSFPNIENEAQVFSLWRLRDVLIQQYQADCQSMRDMIQGKPARPAFLGPPPSTTSIEGKSVMPNVNCPQRGG